jgi:mutual gliding-motility protein MglA
MAFVNLKTKMIQVKIVYYGPGRGGKTTNLEYIYRKFHQRINSEMVTLKTHGDRTLFFDFLPFDLGVINGYQIKIQLYTVPGQVQYNATRQLVLRGVDGLVFVADAMADRRVNNIQSLRNLQENLAGYKKNLHTLPWVIQCNKLDLKEKSVPVMSVAQMEQDLNRGFQRPVFPASALKGANVVATLKRIISLTVTSIRNELA